MNDIKTPSLMLATAFVTLTMLASTAGATTPDDHVLAELEGLELPDLTDVDVPDIDSISLRECWEEAGIETHCALAWASNYFPECGGEHQPDCEDEDYCGPSAGQQCAYVTFGGGGEGVLLGGAAVVSGMASGACSFQAGSSCHVPGFDDYMWVTEGLCVSVTAEAVSHIGTSATAIAMLCYQ